MRKLISVLIVLTLLFTSISFSFAEILKDETIYANLNHRGEIENIKVVNRLHGEGKEDYFTDYGAYKNIKPLVDIDPIIEGDQVKWPLKDRTGKDIYYQGDLDKELPVKVNIKYFLDGKEVEGRDLAGRSGKLKIEIGVENESGLTTQIQLALNLDIFSNIKIENGAGSVVGKTMTVVFTHLAIGDDNFTIEAEGDNIELEPILISSSNFKIPLSGDLEDSSSGIDELSRAFNELEEGSKEINRGTLDLGNGIRALSRAIGDLYTGFSQINTRAREILGGFKDLDFGLKTLKDGIVDLVAGIGQLNKNFNQALEAGDGIGSGLYELKEGTGNLSQGLGQLNQGLGGLNQGHKELVQLAQSLENSQDPRVRALAEGVIEEGAAIEGLTKGLGESYQGINTMAENMEKLYLGHQEYNGGLKEILGGYNQLGEGIQAMPEELQAMSSGHNQLVNGLDSLFEGLGSMDNGIKEINDKTRDLPDNIDKLARGQEDLADGIAKLNREGISKIRDAANVFTEITGDEKQAYMSFVDTRNTNNSSCQFVMKTPSIKIEEVEKQVQVEEKVKKGLIERFLDLFRK